MKRRQMSIWSGRSGSIRKAILPFSPEFQKSKSLLNSKNGLSHKIQEQRKRKRRNCQNLYLKGPENSFSDSSDLIISKSYLMRSKIKERKIRILSNFKISKKKSMNQKPKKWPLTVPRIKPFSNANQPSLSTHSKNPRKTRRTKTWKNLH